MVRKVWIPEDTVMDTDLNYFESLRDLIESKQDKYYRHIQGVASNEWIIFHNLNKLPSVTVKDSTGRTVIGDIDYISDNEVKLTFSGAFSGEAYLN